MHLKSAVKSDAESWHVSWDGLSLPAQTAIKYVTLTFSSLKVAAKAFAIHPRLGICELLGNRRVAASIRALWVYGSVAWQERACERLRWECGGAGEGVCV